MKTPKLSDHLETAVNMNQDLIGFLVHTHPTSVKTKIITDIQKGTKTSLSTAHVMLTALIADLNKKVVPAKKVLKKKPVTPFLKTFKVSSDLKEVIGKDQSTRTEAVRLLWVYIKKHNLQNAKNKRQIDGDDKMTKVFGGKKSVTMFELAKLLDKHLT